MSGQKEHRKAEEGRKEVSVSKCMSIYWVCYNALCLVFKVRGEFGWHDTGSRAC